MAIIERGVVRGPNIVFPQSLSLPEGTEVIVRIEPVGEAESPNASLNEADFMQQPCFGMWKDRPDMEDSVAWVRRERESWNQRLADGG